VKKDIFITLRLPESMIGPLMDCAEVNQIPHRSLSDLVRNIVIRFIEDSGLRAPVYMTKAEAMRLARRDRELDEFEAWLEESRRLISQQKGGETDGHSSG